jgi:predicted alpha/beta-fold hydrolase
MPTRWTTRSFPTIPRATIAANPALHAAIVPHGGHVGFIAGQPGRPEFWAEAEAARFLEMELQR